MRKVLLINVCLLLSLLFISCTKDNSSQNEEKFDYPMEFLYGEWRISHLYENGKFNEVPDWMTETIIFNKNGTYEGTGIFGVAKGNYETRRNTVYCYLAGVIFMNYEFLSLLPTTCEIKMYNPQAPANQVIVRCIK